MTKIVLLHTISVTSTLKVICIVKKSLIRILTTKNQQNILKELSWSNGCRPGYIKTLYIKCRGEYELSKALTKSGLFSAHFCFGLPSSLKHMFMFGSFYNLSVHVQVALSSGSYVLARVRSARLQTHISNSGLGSYLRLVSNFGLFLIFFMKKYILHMYK